MSERRELPPGSRREAAPAVAVDIALLTVVERTVHVLLVQPSAGAFAGRWALPGGRVGLSESLDAAARRELATHVDPRRAHWEQLYTFGNPGRDPHGRVVSVAYLALTPRAVLHEILAAGPKYACAAWQRTRALPPLGYDHRAIVRMALERLRGKLTYTNLAWSLLPPTFTLAELQDVYEAVLARPLDRRNFRKRIFALGLVRPHGDLRRGPHRPAQLFAFRHRRPRTVSSL